AKNEMVGAIDKLSKEAKVADLPFRVVSTAFSSAADLDGAVTSNGTTAIYLCPGLDSSIASITAISRKHSGLSFSGVESFVKPGISIGIVARGGKPAILVNIASSKAEGADLDPALLRLAELVK